MAVRLSALCTGHPLPPPGRFLVLTSVRGSVNPKTIVHLEDLVNCVLASRFTTIAFPKSCISIFWDVTPCSPLKVNWHFKRTCHVHLQGWRISQARNQHEEGSKHSFMLVSCLAYSLTLKMEVICSSKISVHFQWIARHVPENNSL
jgi:hypothetical protein